jgi:LAO/AO transport system kinase
MERKASDHPEPATYRDAILAGNRVILSQAITLTESTLETDRQLAEDLLEALSPYSGKAIRIGITGAPGVGKSTFIEAFGKYITSMGKKLAILTIDPSSQKTKGSILGDKTRMEALSRDPLAFIRPSAAGSAYGGVTIATGESILLCEAAGFEVIIVETVGVGQSEVAVRSLVDFFLLLMLAGSGDDLQGIKKGIMEMADGIAVTKTDGENILRAHATAADFKIALHLFQAPESGVAPRVLTTSAIGNVGIGDTWAMIENFINKARQNGFLELQRKRQQIEIFYSTLDGMLKQQLHDHSAGALDFAEKRIDAGEISPQAAARQLLHTLFTR